MDTMKAIRDENIRAIMAEEDQRFMDAVNQPVVPGILSHQGKKYLRKIASASQSISAGGPIEVDVYSVLEAFDVTCQARGHAIKKLLAAGLRGKGSQLDDLYGALAAVSRAIELQQQRERESRTEPSSG